MFRITLFLIFRPHRDAGRRSLLKIHTFRSQSSEFYIGGQNTFPFLLMDYLTLNRWTGTQECITKRDSYLPFLTITVTGPSSPAGSNGDWALKKAFDV